MNSPVPAPRRKALLCGAAMNRLAREHPLFPLVLLLLLAVLAYGTVRHLTAHAAHPTQATPAMARELADNQGQMSLHVADPSADVGPGCDEAAVARHPSP
jgi:hypothetical protein